MSLFKCKMCGADLEINEGASIAECDYCGTKQTVPKAIDENMQNLFNRANTLRIKSEFDKAEKLYEKIIQSDSTQADAYWGLILCKYGIEYVDDPVTFKKVPTCHRTSYDSIIADDDYKSAIENADMSQRMIYEEQAKEIDRIQKEILALAQKEESYDVFICYKETDSNGSRTQDSVIANDIYYQLTNEGYKVFYAAITLEGKLGSAYEPIIFAALNSAKVMLAIGTKPEYFNAVWVKNEWSRYLKIIKNDRSKLLIPCYRDMDAYELPDEFAHLQAQDMAKIGFINDVVRGIQKVIAKDEPKPTIVKETVVTSGNTNTAPLLRRAFMFLEDGEWSSAEEYCEKVLDIDPECAEAYLGKLMAELRVKTQEDLKNCAKPFDDRNNFNKVLRFGDDNLRNALTGYIKYINDRNKTARLEGIYNRALKAMNEAKNEDNYVSAAKIFESIIGYKDAKELSEKCYIAGKEAVYNDALKQMNSAKSENEFKSAAKRFEVVSGFKDADELARKCYDDAEIARKDAILSAAVVNINHFDYEAAVKKLETIKGFKNADSLISECYEKIEQIKIEEEAARKEQNYKKAQGYIAKNTIVDLKIAIQKLESIPGYRDADELVYTCRNKIEAIEIQAKAEHAERERQLEIARIEKEKRRKRNKKIAAVVIPLILIIAVAAIVYFTVVVPSQKYNDAMAMFESGNYVGASVAFQNLEDYKDSATMVKECQYQNALDLVCDGKYNEALGIFGMLGTYSDSANKKVLVQAIKDLNGEKFESTIKTILEANERVNIKYNLSGGTSALGDYITYLNAAEYSLLIPEKLGYKLAEWKFNSFSYNKETSLEIVLDAVWSDGYIIKYNLDGGTAENPVDYHKDRDAVVIADPVREGYTFLGWTGTDLDAPTKNLTIPAGSYGDREYTANWNINNYSIILDVNGGKVSQDRITIEYLSSCELPTPTREYYTFDGWYMDGVKYENYTMETGSDVTLRARWTPISYTITYSLSGGNNPTLNPKSYTIDSAKISLLAPSRTGYKFIGWYKDSSYKTKVTEISAGSHEDITLYAKWEVITYTITYNLNGGKISGTKKTSFTVNDLPITLATPTRTDCVFLGWKKNDYNGADISKITSCENVTVYAAYMDVYLQLTLYKPLYSYQETETYYKVTKYSGSATTVDIPSYYEGYPVREISSSAFSGKSNITTINIPNTVQTIGNAAFYNCSSLTNIVIPNGVTSIGRSVFNGCSSLRSVSIPSTVKSIGERAFEDCSSLASIQFPSQLSSIGNYAFSGCSSLASINIPGTVKELEYRTFGDCTNLSTIILNEGLQEISWNVFNSTKVTKIIIPKSVTSIDSSAFTCPNVKFYCRSATMPSGWESGWNDSCSVIWGYTGY